MPSKPPSEPNSEAWSICHGLFTMPLPIGWRYESGLYEEGAFILPSGQRLSCRADSFDAPELIAAGQAVDLVREPDLDLPPLSDREIAGNVLMGLKRARGDMPAQLIWKSIDILDDRYVRSVRLSWTLDPADGADAAARSEIAAEVMGAISQGQFAAHVTPLDRVAPSEALKRVSPWGLMYVRVPQFWRCEYVEDGRFVCDALPEDVPPDPTLWFDHDLLGVPETETDLVAKIHALAQGSAEQQGSPDQVKVDLDESGAWVESVAGGYENGTELVFYNMQRHVGEAPYMITALFNLVLTADDAKSRAGRELIDLMHREIRNAVVLARKPDKPPR